MRLRPRDCARALALVLALVLAPAVARASVLVLRDGRAIRYAGELRVDGQRAFFALEDGTLVSVRVGTIDFPATERVRQVLGKAGPPPAASPAGGRREARGPTELERLPEQTLLGALVHTGRSRPGPGEETPGATTASGARPPTGPPRPGRRHVVDLLLEPDVPPAPPGTFDLPRGGRTARGGEGADELPDFGPSPYTGPLEEALLPEGARRLAALVPPPLRQEGELRMAHARLPAREPGAAAAGPARPHFVSPRDGDAVVGPTELRLGSLGPQASVEWVDYRADGRFVGRAESPPFELSWTAPSDRLRHRLEARVRRRDGTWQSARATVLSIVPDAEVDVQLVPLSVAVSNQLYLFVRELEARNFLVYEDGIPQEIAHFSREPAPLSVLVLVDLSFSMVGRKLEMAMEGLRRLAERLGPEDRIGLATFDEELTVRAPLSLDREAVVRALAGLGAGAGTAMLDAELAALDLLSPEGGRRVLILLGDGEDYLSRSSLASVIEAAQRSNVTVFALGLSTYRLRDGTPEHWTEKLAGRSRPAYWTDRLRVRGLKILRAQADETGGVLYLPKLTGEFPYVFEHLLAELKSAYSLGYYPKNARRDGRFREIRVYVDGQGLEARTRKGYFAPLQPGVRSASAR